MMTYPQLDIFVELLGTSLKIPNVLSRLNTPNGVLERDEQHDQEVQRLKSIPTVLRIQIMQTFSVELFDPLAGLLPAWTGHY